MSDAARLGAIHTAIARHWESGRATERLLIVEGASEWDGPQTISVDGVDVPIRVAVSGLEVRELLASSDGRLVVITDVAEPDLGRDVLAQAVSQQAVTVNVWEMLSVAFGMSPTAPMDSGLVRQGSQLARELLAITPRPSWRQAPSGVLSREHVMRELAVSVLGLQADRIDGAGLTVWTLDPQGGLALRDLPTAVRDHLVAWLVDKAGPGAGAILRVVLQGEGTDAIPLGILLGLTARKAHGTPDGRARGLIESRLGGRPTQPEIDAWWQLVDAWRQRQPALDPQVLDGVMARVEAIAEELEVVDALGDNDVLEASFVARSRRAGAAVKKAASSSRELLVADELLAALRRHWLAEHGSDVVSALEMAVRVARWVATDPQSLPNLDAALSWQINTGGWVDRARQVVANGCADPEVASDLADVHEIATARRVLIDQSAAAHLAHAVGSDQRPGGLIPVEDALARLLPELGELVLLVVVDGMSAAVATEIAESVIRLGWVEQVVEDGERKGLLAGLPTMTEVSRTSLLTGKRQRGDQRTERSQFSAVAGARSVLFHKGDLVAAVGHDVAGPVRESILDGSAAVVGVVLNAVDDSLSKGAPGSTPWDVDSVTHLRQLLDHARAAGRTVVLTSDHGHVVDREPGELRTAPGGSGRWRPDTADVADDEVRLSGARVLLGDGAVVAAVGERLRYAKRSAGYHGGAALAEIAIPWLAFIRRGSELAGHVTKDVAPPDWWTSTPLEPGDDGLF